MTTAHGQSLMVPGQYLEPGEMLVSENNTFVLVYQKDGNLVLYQLSETTKTPTWASNTSGGSPGRTYFDKDGALVIKDAWGGEVWRSPVWRVPQADRTLRLQNDGNVVACELEPQDESVPTAANTYWSTNTAERLERYAVLIGVENYPHMPGQELLAGRNDVLAMWQVCRRMGYKPQHIRVCTSPVLDKAQIVEAEVALALSLPESRGKSQEDVRQGVKENLAGAELKLTDATFDAMLDAVTWLGQHVSKPFLNDKGTMVPAMLTYSGHGAQVDGYLALCPSDAKKVGDANELTNVLSFRDIQELLCGYDVSPTQARNPLKYLTVVLDCCLAGGAGAPGTPDRHEQHRVTSLNSGTAPSQAPVELEPMLGQRIFCATLPNERGYQALLGGRWHGAFTWAFTQALEQWNVEKNAGLYPYSSISHTELLFRARMLLEALSFRQHPMLLDSIGNTPVFWSDGERVDGEQYSRSDLNVPVKRPYTSAEPNVERAGIQMDPGGRSYRHYTFSDAKGLIAEVLVIGSKALLMKETRYDANTESWYSASPRVPSGELTVAWADYDESQSPKLQSRLYYFSMTRNAVWSERAESMPAKSSTVFVDAGKSIALSWELTVDSSNGKWGGSLTWYTKSTSTDKNNLFGNLTSGTKLASNTDAGAGWYSTKLVALS